MYLDDYTLYAQSKNMESLYSLFEDFEKLSLSTNENNLLEKKDFQQDQTIRLWKLKKRIKNISLYDNTINENDNQETLHNEELQEERLPLEQKYQKQIGKLEMKLRSMKKKNK